MDQYEPPFVITNEMLNSVSEIMEIIGRIGALDNLNRFPVLRKQNRVRSIHSSCYIEANSLSFDQVQDIINGKTVIGPEKDIIEIVAPPKPNTSIEDATTTFLLSSKLT